MLHIASLALVLAACAVETAPLGPAELTALPTAPFSADASVPGTGSAGPAGPTPDPVDASVSVDVSTEAARTDARAEDVAVDVLQPSTPCDRDGDGRLAPSCGGDDCCDTDPRVYRGAPGWFDVPTACGTFDYDCDGWGTRETAVLACSFQVFDWCAGEGFQSDTWCGETGAYAECQLQGLSCGPANTRARKQRCR